MGNLVSRSQTNQATSDDIDKIQYKCDVKRLENLLNIGRVIGNYQWSKENHGYKPPKPHFKTDNVQLLLVPDQPNTLTTKNRKESLKWRMREYFIEKPDHEIEKYMEGNDVMIENGYVYVEGDIPDPLSETDAIKLRLIDFVAGSIAGIMQTCVAQPFDTIKVKLQIFPKIYKNMFACFSHTVKNDGYIRGLYAGTLPAIVASVAENSVLFASYGGCQSFIASIFEISETNNLSIFGNACAGVLSAFFTAFTLCPTELVKCKLQAISETKQYVIKDSKTAPVTAFQITRNIIQTEGFTGLFRGLSSTIAREMPGLFFFFGGYEGTRKLLAEEGQSRDEISDWKTMTAGAVGGLALWIFIFPVDVIKTRIQVNNIKRSMLSVGWDIVHKEGILALYNGLLPTVLRTTPACATLFYSYEQFKKLMTNAANISSPNDKHSKKAESQRSEEGIV